MSKTNPSAESAMPVTVEETPLQKFDTSKWPKGVRPLSIDEFNGLGIDDDNRIYWDGKPVEIGRRVDLTRSQIWIAIVIAAATVVGALAACVQGAAAYYDWACKVDWPVWAACPPKQIIPFFRNDLPLLRND